LNANSHRGYSAELAVASRLVAKGLEIAFPHGPTATDLVVRAPGGCWQSVQIKAGSWQKGRDHPTVDLRQAHCSTLPYPEGHIDFFIVWLPEHKDFWVFPGSVVARSIRLEPSLHGFNNLDILKETSCRVCPHPRP
jgi:hypothetical protein